MSAESIPQPIPQPVPQQNDTGMLYLLFGCMSSGKTTELMKLLIVDSIVEKSVLYVNHSLDMIRITDGGYYTHNPVLNPSASDTGVKQIFTEDLFSLIVKEQNTGRMIIDDYSTVGIDEAQFFDKNIVEFVLILVEKYHKKVYVAGLSTDFKRHQFGNFMNLVPYADEIIHLKGRCARCAKSGIHSDSLFTHKRLTTQPKQPKQIEIGGLEMYESSCRRCYLEMNKNIE